MSRRVKIVIAVALAAVAAIALFAVVGLVARDGASTSGSTQMSAVRSSAGAMAIPAPAAAEDGSATDKSLAGGTGAGDIAAALPPASAPSAHYLLRTGDLSLLVARGTLLSAVDRVKSMTAGMGGYVMSSSLGTQTPGPIEPMPLDDPVSSMEDRGASAALATPYATLVVRVPEQLFDTAIKRFSKLGEVQSASTSSEDVTSQYVDLQARLRHFRAVERRLIGFLSETTNVNQMLRVQDRIDAVQLTIEELTAQMKSLRETTTYGTLSVYMTEKDSKPAAIHASNTFGGTFWNSIRLLGHGARVTGLVLTALAPFVVVFGAVGVLVWFIVRRWRRSRRQAAQPALPA